MIEIKNIHKRFGDNEVLKGIDATFKTGSTNMIIGTSGSGKTVLMKCIVGLFEPEEGAVVYDGRNFTHMSYKDRKQIRQEMGMLFQGSALFDSLTVEENVGFPLKIFTKKSSKEIRDRVNDCLTRVKLSNVNDLLPSEISGGMQKRVGIARAISMNPKYLFVDEPNSGLDPQTSIVIDDLIKEITIEYNMTTVINTHDMNSMFTMGDHVLFLHKGHKYWEGNPRKIKESGVDELMKFVFAAKFLKEIHQDI